MAQNFTAQLGKITDDLFDDAVRSVKAASQDVFEEMSQTQPSIKETGTFEEGKVPVDTGILINSLFSQKNGKLAGRGSTSYVAMVAGFKAGETMLFAFSAEYALRMEYGFFGPDSLGRIYNQPGRFFMRDAINGAGGWNDRVNAYFSQFRAQSGV